MNNIVQLRDELKKVFTGIKSGKMNTKKAKELNNTAAKIMNSVSLEMKRETQTGRRCHIAFIDNNIQYSTNKNNTNHGKKIKKATISKGH